MGQIQKEQKESNRKIPYEDITAALENRPDMVYYLEFETIDTPKTIEYFKEDLKVYIEKDDLNTNEYKLGTALLELFENYGNIFIGTDNNKFNKNIVLLSLREMTNLNTKEIRLYLKKYKTLYLETLKKIHNQ
jgi:hypothetical protein